MRAYWVGVASREHVLAAVAGGFCQLNHGKEAPLKRLQTGDAILYYSPRQGIRDGETVQAFTAIGQVLAEPPYQVEHSQRFRPFRRKVDYAKVHQAPIRPLLPQLGFTRSNEAWGQVMRRGLFRIGPSDFNLIASRMGAQDRAAGSEPALGVALGLGFRKDPNSAFETRVGPVDRRLVG